MLLLRCWGADSQCVEIVRQAIVLESLKGVEYCPRPVDITGQHLYIIPPSTGPPAHGGPVEFGVWSSTAIAAWAPNQNSVASWMLSPSRLLALPCATPRCTVWREGRSRTVDDGAGITSRWCAWIRPVEEPHRRPVRHVYGGPRRSMKTPVVPENRVGRARQVQGMESSAAASMVDLRRHLDKVL